MASKTDPVRAPIGDHTGDCRGVLSVNADDWGCDRHTTDRTYECVRSGAISSVSAIVFMEDSERAAAVCRQAAIDAGLHLNFTTPFSSSNCPSRLAEHQERTARYLTSHRLSQVLFHPGLASSFSYVVAAQIEEYVRLYGEPPKRIDAHHHIHLCTNVLLPQFLPQAPTYPTHFCF